MAAAEPRFVVFVSYSHDDDRKWIGRIRVRLAHLIREGRVELWDDTRIKAGERWREEIRAALARARVAVLLISADFYASDFIANNELPPLLEAEHERGLVILGVHISHSRFDRDQVLSEYQTINPPGEPIEDLSSRGKQEEVFANLARRIEELLDRPNSAPITAGQTETRKGPVPQRKTSMRQPPREDSGLGIVELNLERPSQWTGNCFPLLVEARFGSSDLLDNDGGLSIEFGIKKAFLRLDLRGCQIVQGSRSYEGTHPAEIIQNIETHESREQQRQGELTGSAKASALRLPNVDIGAKGKASVTVTRRAQSAGQRVEVRRAVTALPNQRWEIVAIEEDYLKGLYITADPALCEIEVNRKNHAVSACAEFKVVGDNIEIIDIQYKENRDRGILQRLSSFLPEKDIDIKTRAIKMIIAKALREQGDLVEIMCCHLNFRAPKSAEEVTYDRQR